MGAFLQQVRAEGGHSVVGEGVGGGVARGQGDDAGVGRIFQDLPDGGGLQAPHPVGKLVFHTVLSFLIWFEKEKSRPTYGTGQHSLRYHPTWLGTDTPARLSPLTRDHVGHTGGLPCSGTPSRVHSPGLPCRALTCPRLSLREILPLLLPFSGFLFSSRLLYAPGRQKSNPISQMPAPPPACPPNRAVPPAAAPMEGRKPTEGRDLQENDRVEATENHRGPRYNGPTGSIEKLPLYSSG